MQLVLRRAAVLAFVVSLFPALLPAQSLSPEVRSKIDIAVQNALAESGAPSASVAIVTDDQVAYTKAYGSAKIEPKTPARTEMRYSIGSVSKQFTAAAILKLAEQGKL